MFESLEPRQFLSVTPGFSVSKGRTLYIRGTDAADTIVLSYPLDSGGLTLSINNVDVADYLPGAFRRVAVDAGDGDDTIDLKGAGRPAEVFAGAGNDTVRSPDGSDALFGYSGGAASTVSGGDGDDSLQGGNHNDNLFGEAGDDTLFGDGGYDTLEGGPGTDTWRPSRGSDFASGDLEVREDLGATLIHDDLDLSQLHYKVTRQNGHTILRLTVFFTRELGYDVSFSELSPSYMAGVPGVITVDYTRLIDRPARPFPTGHPFVSVSRRAYYDLGTVSPVFHTIQIVHPSGSAIRTLSFRA